MELNLEEMVKARLDDMDLEDMVKGEIRSLLHGDIHRTIREVLQKQVGSIIETEIKISMKKGVATDNGWGEKATYASFEDLFRKTFAEKMKNSWEIQKKVEEYVKQEVRQLMDANFTAASKKLAEDILASTVKKA